MRSAGLSGVVSDERSIRNLVLAHIVSWKQTNHLRRSRMNKHHKIKSISVDFFSFLNRLFLRIFSVRISRILHKSDFKRILAWLSPCYNGHSLIRVGAERDGGYLVPDDLEGIVACFSPGTDQVVEFEKYFFSQGVRCYLADASVSENPFQNPLVDFKKKYISGFSHGDFLSLEDWIVSSFPSLSGDMVLQIDIEGWEYQALSTCPLNLLEKFRIVIIEFHDFHRTVDRYFYRDLLAPVIAKLSSAFDPVHIHPNNASPEFSLHGYRCPQAFELTLHRKDRRCIDPPVSSIMNLPHILDQDNVSSKRTLAISKDWPIHHSW